MNGDRRQNNINRQNTAQQNRGGNQVNGNIPLQGASVHTNISGRHVNPTMQPRRTAGTQQGAVPQNGRVQQQYRPQRSTGGQYVPSGTAYPDRAAEPRPQRSHVNGQMSVNRTAVPQENDMTLAEKVRSSWVVKAFAPDPHYRQKIDQEKQLKEEKKARREEEKRLKKEGLYRKERNIVREQGSMDYVFLFTVLILLCFGSVMVYSASYAYAMNRFEDSYYFIFKQLFYGGAGVAVMIVTSRLKTEKYRFLSFWVYLALIILLIAVLGIGIATNGAQRWFKLGPIKFQPSEVMKFGLVMFLAYYYDRYYERVTDHAHRYRASFFGVVVPMGIIGLACVLVLLEKHLSGTIILFAIGAIMIFVSGAPLKLLGIIGLVGVGGLGISALVTDYTKRRIDIWLNPGASPLDGGYQTLQGLYAIGSGGIFGKGLGNSYQKHMFVSQPQNDFIFTIVCEELGFIGAMAVIVLFLLLAWRGFVIAMKAPDIFSSMLVIGIISKVVVQAILNIAVVTNSIPNTGISLPFFSYGGTALIVLMAEMGIVLSISRFSGQKKL